MDKLSLDLQNCQAGLEHFLLMVFRKEMDIFLLVFH